MARSSRGWSHRLEVGRGERVVDLVDLGRRELQEEVLPLPLVAEVDLDLLGLEREAADEPRVAAKVLAEFGFHLGQGPVDDLAVDVAAAEVRITAGAEDLHGLVVHDPDDRDVERAAAEVEDDEGLRLAPVEPIRDGSGRRLVDDQPGVELGDLGRLARGVLLRLLEPSRDGDHRVVDRLADHLLGAGLELLQDVGRDHLGIELHARPVRHRLAARPAALP